MLLGSKSAWQSPEPLRHYGLHISVTSMNLHRKTCTGKLNSELWYRNKKQKQNMMEFDVKVCQTKVDTIRMQLEV